jgi:hypothetical protein
MRSVSYQRKVNGEFFPELLVVTANVIQIFIQNLLASLWSSIFMCLVLPNPLPVCGFQSSWNCHLRLHCWVWSPLLHPEYLKPIFSRRGASSSNTLVLHIRDSRFESRPGVGCRDWGYSKFSSVPATGIRRSADKSLTFTISYLQHNQKNFSWMG